MFTRWLVFHVASGQSMFSGAACLIVAIWLSARAGRARVRIVRNVLVFLGGALVFVSATPRPAWGDVLLIVVSLLWLAGEASRGRVPDRVILGLRTAIAAAWLAAVLVEAPYQRSPTVPRLGRPILGVIGDSLSAGTSHPRAGTWPAILADRHGVVVRDHSQMGATVGSASSQAASVGPDERLILLEIGGNDVLGQTRPEEFEQGLDRLLTGLRRPGRVVVMLELPLPPTCNAYGRIQRRLARRYDTILVPKRVLLGVLQRRGATIDTIHLTREGHERMADVVWNVVQAAYRDGEGP